MAKSAIRVEYGSLDGELLIPAVYDATFRVAQNARRRAPRRTGKLAASIEHRISRALGVGIPQAPKVRNCPVGEVEAMADYAIFVHEGTGIYGRRHRPIVARNGRVLAFPGRDGRMVFTRTIRGQRGQPFLTDALRDVTGQG